MRRHTSLQAPPLAHAIARLLIGLALPHAASAQEAGALPTIEITAPKDRESRASIAGFGSEPEWQQPLQAKRYGASGLKSNQIQSLSDLIKLDARVSDSYNATGYTDMMSIRGFVLDQIHNYRREGLPIDAQTFVPLQNKEAIEILFGTSGMQAGTSSPGGLVNYVIKRPDGHVRTAELGLTSHGGTQVAVDLGERFGQNDAFGLRLNAAHAHLNTAIQNTAGQSDLLALAGDWRLSPSTLIEAEIEHSRRSQHSVPGFSMLGSVLPSPSSIDRNVNLNNQSWASPVVFQGDTGTLRLTHKLNDGWKLQGIYGEQHTVADDRAAFPYGGPACYVTGNDCDRFGADGSFNLLNYRSDGEARLSRSLDANVSGNLSTGTVQHEVTAGVLRTVARIDLPTASFTWTGIGNVTGNFTTPNTAEPDSPQNNRRERSTELYLRDSLKFSEAWRAWVGLRRTQLHREQWQSDGSYVAQPVSETFTTPWAALGYQWAPHRQAYMSWGEGVEILPALFRTPYGPLTNSGEVLPMGSWCQGRIRQHKLVVRLLPHQQA